MLSVLSMILLSNVSFSVDASQALFLQDISRNFEAPVIVQIGDFDELGEAKFDTAIQQAVNLKQPIIPVVINSYGGSVYSLLHIVDTLNALQEKGIIVATIGLGKSMSCGAILLAMGSPGFRYATENTTVLVHDIATKSGGKLPDIVNEAQEMQRLSAVVFGMMAKRANRPESFFLDLLKNSGHIDMYLSADKSKELGIIDHVGLPTLKIKVETKVWLE